MNLIKIAVISMAAATLFLNPTASHASDKTQKTSSSKIKRKAPPSLSSSKLGGKTGSKVNSVLAIVGSIASIASLVDIVAGGGSDDDSPSSP
jgi:uncharacterized membrane protein YdfJ with MMPL/SSD domain